jgi:hypothetical protein
VSSLLQIVNPASTGEVWFDLNDPTGVANAEWGSVQTALRDNPDWGSAALEAVRFEGEMPGGETPRTRPALTSATLPVIFKATSYDNLRAGVNRLSFLLEQRTTWRWVGDGSTTILFAVIEPSDKPVLVDGRALSLWDALHNFSHPEGVSLRLVRQPFFLGGELASTDNLLTNSTLLTDQDDGGTPDGWAWDVTTNITGQTIAAADDAYKFTIATTGTRNLQQTTANSTITGSATYTGSVYAKASAAGIARLTAAWQGKDNAGVNQGTEITSTQTTLTTAWQRISGSGAASPSAAKALVSLRMANAAATSVDVYLHFAQLNAGPLADYRVGSQVVSNDPSATSTQGRAGWLYNAGATWAPFTSEIIADSGASITEAQMSLRSNRGTPGSARLADWVNTRKYLELNAGTAGTDWSTIADAATSSGTAGSVSFSTTSSLARRVRRTYTSKLDTMRGEYEVSARVKPSNASAFKLQLQWAPSLSDVGMQELPTVTLDALDATTFDYVEVPLGVIQVPRETDLAGLAFELWAQRSSGTGTLRADTLCFAPVDETAGTVVMPTRGNHQLWEPENMTQVLTRATADTFTFVTSTINDNGYQVLNARYEAVGVPIGSTTAGGITLPAGRVVFRLRWFFGGNDPNFTGVFRVVNTTTATEVVTASKTFTETLGNQGTSAGSYLEKKLEFDTVASNTYQPQVYLSNYVAGNVFIIRMEMDFVPYVAANERILIEPETPAVHKLDSTGKLVLPLRHKGQVPVWAPPGLSAFYLVTADSPIDGIDHPRTTLTRAPTVRTYHSPRFYI